MNRKSFFKTIGAAFGGVFAARIAPADPEPPKLLEKYAEAEVISARMQAIRPGWIYAKWDNVIVANWGEPPSFRDIPYSIEMKEL